MEKQQMNNEMDDILQAVDAFIDQKVIPQFSETVYPEHLVMGMKKIGFFGMTVPAQYGGSELSLPQLAQVVRSLARGSISLTGLLGSHLKVCKYIADFGTEEQKQVYLPLAARGDVIFAHALTEDQGKSLDSLETKITRDEDKLLLNGHKSYVTNGINADKIAVVAKDEEKTRVVLVDNNAKEVRHSEDLDRMGFNGVSLCRVYFDDYEFEAHDIIGGPEQEAQPMMKSVKTAALINYSARAIGLILAVKGDTEEFISNKQSNKTILAEIPAVDKAYQNMLNSINECEEFYDQLLQDAETGNVEIQYAYEAKLKLTEAAVSIALQSMQLYGGAGYMKSHRIERYLRDAIALTIIGTPSNTIKSKLEE